MSKVINESKNYVEGEDEQAKKAKQLIANIRADEAARQAAKQGGAVPP
jgi:hypothetical protein